MDRGAWRATVHGVAKSWTLLKELSTHARQWSWGLQLLQLVSETGAGLIWGGNSLEQSLGPQPETEAGLRQ